MIAPEVKTRPLNRHDRRGEVRVRLGHLREDCKVPRGGHPVLNLLQRIVGVQRHDGRAQHQPGEQINQTNALEALAKAREDTPSGDRATGGSRLRWGRVLRGYFRLFRCHERPSLGRAPIRYRVLPPGP